MSEIKGKGQAAKGQKKQEQVGRNRVMGELKSGRSALGRRNVGKPEAKAPKYIATHVVVSGDTLSGIALKYYGSAVREKWMAIYEANKETIGDNPSMIRVGQTLNIPQLPE